MVRGSIEFAPMYACRPAHSDCERVDFAQAGREKARHV